MASPWSVTIIFSTGREQFLAGACKHPAFRLVKGDLLDEKAPRRRDGRLRSRHPFGRQRRCPLWLEHPRRDLEQNTIGTFHVLEAMRAQGIRDLAFSSTGSVYGEATVIPTPEDAPMPLQTSLYGALQTGRRGPHFRLCGRLWSCAPLFSGFVSILGPRYSHGHVFDFYRQLAENPKTLRVLGDGTQRKSYLAVEDCVEAILQCFAREAEASMHPAKGSTQIYNLGTDEYCQVNDSIGWTCGVLGVQPEIHYTGGDRGWVGDNPLHFPRYEENSRPWLATPFQHPAMESKPPSAGSRPTRGYSPNHEKSGSWPLASGMRHDRLSPQIR